MTISIPTIYPITDTTVSKLSHAQQVTHLLGGGATFIQLRDKKSSARAFYNDASDAIRIARSSGAVVIINDRVDIALALGADGVHLGQSDMPVGSARKLLGSNAIIGYSTHDIEQVQEALNLPIDYLAFGPIFPTHSKRNPDPVAGLEALHEIKLLLGSMPLVAIGGISESSLIDVLAAGANSAAVISAILADPARIAENLRNLSTIGSNKHS